MGEMWDSHILFCDGYLLGGRRSFAYWVRIVFYFSCRLYILLDTLLLVYVGQDDKKMMAFLAFNEPSRSFERKDKSLVLQLFNETN